MQTFPHTPAHAQHVPDGWSFPVLSAQTPSVEPAQSVPVTGGGAVDQTVTRVKWGRVLLVFAGLVLFGFGAWNMSGGGATTPSKDASNSRTVTGGGGSDVEIEAATGAEDDIAMGSDAVTGDDATAETPAETAPAAAPVTTPAAPARRAAGRTARRGAATAPAFAPNAAAATAPRTATGGGAGAGAPAGQLPVTGLETWFAAFLGVLLLAVGICVHVSAVRIATTALLYRRGILLRPSECARLAQDHGFARVRVFASDVLHRLLEEPTHGGDFVSARPAA